MAFVEYVELEGRAAAITSMHVYGDIRITVVRERFGFRTLFRGHRALFEAALDVVARCPCERGCPACVGPPEEVGMLGKEIARAVLEHMAAGAELREAETEEA